MLNQPITMTRLVPVIDLQVLCGKRASISCDGFHILQESRLSHVVIVVVPTTIAQAVLSCIRNASGHIPRNGGRILLEKNPPVVSPDYDDFFGLVAFRYSISFVPAKQGVRKYGADQVKLLKWVPTQTAGKEEIVSVPGTHFLDFCVGFLKPSVAHGLLFSEEEEAVLAMAV